MPRHHNEDATCARVRWNLCIHPSMSLADGQISVRLLFFGVKLTSYVGTIIGELSTMISTHQFLTYVFITDSPISEDFTF